MAVTYNSYNAFIEYMGDNTIDMDGDTFVITLHNAYTFSSTQDEYSEPSTSEIATGFGYTQKAETLASVTWGQTGGTVVWDAANVTWTASGGTIGPATDAIVYSDTSSSDKLVCNIDFGQSESAGTGSDFQINWNASGIFTGAFS